MASLLEFLETNKRREWRPQKAPPPQTQTFWSRDAPADGHDHLVDDGRGTHARPAEVDARRGGVERARRLERVRVEIRRRDAELSRAAPKAAHDLAREADRRRERLGLLIRCGGEGKGGVNGWEGER
jgi:hypothetical protein